MAHQPLIPSTTRPKKKLDRRQRRTRKLLGAALLDLIQEQGLANISIQEITDRADVNRATFYLHYGSKEELLVDTLEERFDQLVEQMESQIENQAIWHSEKGELLIFEHVAEHAEFYKILLSDLSAGYTTELIINYVANIGKTEMQRDFPDRDPLEIEMISRHYAGSLYSLIVWWVNHDMPIPAEKMARWVYQTCLLGAASHFDMLPPSLDQT